ncbi:immunoglobulin domain-containing protein, partial [Algoriphagus chordae]
WFSNSSNSTTGATSVGTGTTFTPPTTTAETTYYFAVAASATCGSITSDIVEIEVTPETTIDTHPIGSVYCQNETPTDLSVVATGTGSIAYEWFSNTSNSTIGATSVGTGNTFTPPTTSDGSLFYFAVATSPTCGSATSDIVEIEVTPTNTVTPASTSPELCINTTMPVINHTTTGATGIKVESDEVDYNLPNGVTATWESNVISITGTPAEEGIFNYSIPLEGGCGEIFAEGNITVTDPSYPISGINVDNPGLGDPLPATSTFTVYSPGLTLGTYTVNYSRTGANSGPDQNISVTVTTAGEFTFTSPSYSNEGSTILTINSIQKSTDLCPDYPTGAKTVLYGISCSVEFDRINGNQEFYVPANVTQVTIQVFGNGTGGNTDIHTMNVWPSGVIFAGFSGSDVFATEVPSSEPAATRIANAIINVTGPNGKVKFNYICDSTIPSCATLVDDGNSFIDSDGFTVIRFDNLGTCTWSAPEGLDEFEVLVIGGAGGGGYGNTAGGGAGGGVIYRAYSGITSTGDDGLQGASFTIQVGNGGAGGTGSIIRGATGNPSAFSAGTFDYSNVRNSIGGTLSGAGSFSSLTALGGGGGGSTGSRNGINGASGGGSASSWSGLFNTFIGIFGNGSIPQGQNGGSSYAINIFGVAGGAGGGGGGAGGPGSNGTNSLFGIAGIYGGNGGDGLPFNFTETTEYFGAGGGGTSSGEQGAGGSAGAGGNAVSGGAGQNGQTYGSGGGAGSSGGGAGFQGVVYIRYPNYRILPVEYLYFNATYNDFQRSGDLTWATAKEWENDRFEIERSVNNVKDWEAIGEVSGAGYSDAEVKYDYSDIKLPVAGGNIFYRLKQYDFDGDFTYSDTKSIKVEALPGTTHWRVFPNPTTGHPFNIEILDPSAYHDEPITLRIISATGQFHTIQVSEMRRMGTQVSEWFSAQASGIFTIEISWGDQREYHNVILRR